MYKQESLHLQALLFSLCITHRKILLKCVAIGRNMIVLLVSLHKGKVYASFVQQTKNAPVPKNRGVMLR